MFEFIKYILERILPPKATVGFFQERDGKTGEIKNSSTRLFQVAMITFLFLFTKLIFTNVFKAGITLDLNTLIFILIFYVLTLIATFAPKSFKDIAEIRALVETLSNNKPKTKE